MKAGKMAHLEIRLLGPFQVVLDGEAIAGFESSKVRGLLAYLAAEAKHSQSRERLAGLLWPDWPQKSALRNLSHTLLDLRKNIGDREAEPPFLLISREVLQLNPESDVWVDVGEFEKRSAISYQLSADRVQPSTIHDLQSAIELYRGEFLEGFSLADSPAFEEWVLAKREYYRRQGMQALHILAEALGQRDEYEPALAYARRQLELEPWLEQAHRQVMLLLARSGQRSAALDQYEACQRLLAKEPGVKPSADTTRLFEAIRDEGLSTEHPFQRDGTIGEYTISAAPETAGPQSLPSGTVTFLFTDIEGSTSLWERQPEQMAAALQIHNAALRTAIEAHGGVVFKTVGDAFQAAFATAPQALQAAIAGQRALQASSWNELGPLRVRMGLHTGDAEVDPGGDEYAVSHTKNRAARIMSAGHGGQVLVSLATAELLSGHLPPDVTLEDLGEHALKGLLQPERLFQVFAPGLPSGFPALNSLTRPQHNLPLQLTSFVGREKELDELGIQVADPHTRLVTILGPGGMGKTRLALALAANQLNGQLPHPFAQGIYFVSLARLETAGLLAPAIAEAIGFRFTDGEDLQEQLIRHLAAKAMLLVLDNFEHLLPGAGLVEAILRAAPRVKIVITSRIRLNRQVEQLFPIGGMQVPPVSAADRGGKLDELSRYSAVQLFVQAARRLQPNFELTADNQSPIVEICRLMQGMPLGIVLAAAWLDTLSPGDIRQEIQRDLDFLASDMDDIPARQHSLRAAFDHSWRLLTGREREIVSQMSIFRGGFTLSAVQAITGAAIHDLKALVNKSLLMQTPERRYEVHELVRQFAAEKLSELGDFETAARERHSAYYCQFLQQQTPNWHNARQLDALAEVTREADNIHAAWRRALQQGAWQRILAAIDSWGWYHKWRGLYAEGESFCQAICTQIERQFKTQPEDAAEGTLLWAKALVWQGEFTADGMVAAQRFAQGLALLSRTELAGLDTCQVEANALLGLGERFDQLDRKKARSYLEQSLHLFRALHIPWGVAKALQGLGRLDWSAGNYELSQKRAQESLAIQQEQGDLWGQISSISTLAWVSMHLGQLAEAEQLWRQAVDLCYQLGDRQELAFSTANLAYSLMWQGRYTNGLEWAEKSVEICLEDGYRVCEGYAYLAVGMALLYIGHYGQAQQKLTRSLALVREVNHHGVEATVQYMLGSLALAETACEKAQAAFEESLRLYQSVQGDAYTFLALCGLGFASCCSGNLEQSRHYFMDVLNIAMERKDFLALINALPGVALYLLRKGEVEQAIAVWAQAQSHPYIANSQWYKDVVGNALEAATVDFASETIDSAIARGHSMDTWQMGRSLLVELTETK